MPKQRFDEISSQKISSTTGKLDVSGVEVQNVKPSLENRSSQSLAVQLAKSSQWYDGIISNLDQNDTNIADLHSLFLGFRDIWFTFENEPTWWNTRRPRVRVSSGIDSISSQNTLIVFFALDDSDVDYSGNEVVFDLRNSESGIHSVTGLVDNEEITVNICYDDQFLKRDYVLLDTTRGRTQLLHIKKKTASSLFIKDYNGEELVNIKDTNNLSAAATNRNVVKSSEFFNGVKIDNVVFESGRVDPTDGSVNGSGTFNHYRYVLPDNAQALRLQITTYSSPDTVGLAFYDSSNVFISGFQRDESDSEVYKYVPIPNGSAYFRNGNTINPNNDFGYEFVVLNVYYDNAGGEVRNIATSENRLSAATVGQVFALKDILDLIVKSESITEISYSSGRLDPLTGDVVPSGGFKHYTIDDVSGYKNIKFQPPWYSTNQNVGWAFYDENDAYITGGFVTDPIDYITVDIPANAVFFRNGNSNDELPPGGYTFDGITLFSLSSQGGSVGESTQSGMSGVGCIDVKDIDSEYNMVVSYGQSNEIGQQSYPALTTSNFRGNLMMGTSIYFTQSETIDKDQFFPLVAVDVNAGIDPDNTTQSYSEGQSICLSNGLKRLFDRNIARIVDRKFVPCCTAFGGQTIEQLSKGTGNYNNFLSSINQMKTNCDGLSKTCDAPIVSWNQGEAQYRGGTNVATEKDAVKVIMEQLFVDMASDINTVFASESTPLFVYQQTYAESGLDPDQGVGMAQLELSQENSNYVLSNPQYMFYPSGRGNHHDPNTNRWNGEYKTKAVAHTLLYGTKFAPLQPTRIAYESDVVTIDFYVPVPPLVYDDYTISGGAVDWGFALGDDSGTVQISNVSISGCSVVITCDRQITGELHIAAGRSGGNGGIRLRDSDKWESEYTWEDHPYQVGYVPKDKDGVSIVGKKLPMYNFCVMFSYRFTDEINI